MHGIHHELEILGEQRPGVEAFPFVAEFCADAELGVAALEKAEHFGAVAAIELELKSLEQFAELDYVRHHQRRVDGLRQSKTKRSDLSALDGRGERAGADRAVVALLEQGQHTLAELGQLRLRPLAAEQIAAELAVKLSDGAGKRRLAHMTFPRTPPVNQGAS